ncbi:hypothetical protein BT93_F3073 [Corymbia citriodora subsp. variegata]|nr:hypothetical protein BT93_F3073 [Corymbia citriodora subsp. variegata]
MGADEIGTKLHRSNRVNACLLVPRISVRRCFVRQKGSRPQRSIQIREVWVIVDGLPIMTSSCLVTVYVNPLGSQQHVLSGLLIGDIDEKGWDKAKSER